MSTPILTPPRATFDASRDLFEKNPSIMFLIDPGSGEIADANEAAALFYGYSVEELRLMRVFDLNIDPEDEIRRELECSRDRRKSVFFMKHRLKSGEIRDIEIHSGPIELQGKKLLLSILNDVSERRRLQEQLWQAQKMEVMGQMAGGVAHDFNNLLTAMMTSLDLILEEPSAGPSVRRLTEQMLQSATVAQGLTARLLAFSRKQVLQPRKMDLNEVVRDVVSLLERLAGPLIQVSFAAHPAGCWVRADGPSLRQVLMNLVVNARDAMPDGGTIEISSLLKEDWVELRVRDSGAGMDEYVKSRLFEPFFTTKDKEKGTGLGLATVYGIVGQNEGQIEVASSPGRGSLFLIRLPSTPPPGLEVEETAPARPPAHDPSLPAKPLGVLVVEDDRDIREVLVEALRRDGFQVIEASGALQAISLFQNEPRASISLLVTDVLMMGMSGTELATRLLLLQPELRVLFISGYADGQITERITARTGSAFLQKPFTARVLVERARRVLNS